jgi:hypothetical protein
MVSSRFNAIFSSRQSQKLPLRFVRRITTRGQLI